MTHRAQTVLQWLGVGGIAALVAAGIAYGSTTTRIETATAAKLDASRFVADSIRRDEREFARDARIEDALRRVEAGQRETNERLRELACPPDARGCR